LEIPHTRHLLPDTKLLSCVTFSIRPIRPTLFLLLRVCLVNVQQPLSKVSSKVVSSFESLGLRGKLPWLQYTAFHFVPTVAKSRPTGHRRSLPRATVVYASIALTTCPIAAATLYCGASQ